METAARERAVMLVELPRVLVTTCYLHPKTGMCVVQQLPRQSITGTRHGSETTCCDIRAAEERKRTQERTPEMLDQVSDVPRTKLLESRLGLARGAGVSAGRRPGEGEKQTADVHRSRPLLSRALRSCPMRRRTAWPSVFANRNDSLSPV